MIYIMEYVSRKWSFMPWGSPKKIIRAATITNEEAIK
jgi:hypothetical protein